MSAPVWSQVDTGWVIRGQDGNDWTCVAVKGREITLSRPGKKPFTKARPPDTEPLNVVSQPAPLPVGEQPGVAQALVAVRLGGVVVSKQGKDKRLPHHTPVELQDPATALAHLYIFHGVTSDIQDLHGLRKQHASLHGPNEKAADAYEPHVHTPDFDDL